jgi:hypothetical protein
MLVPVLVPAMLVVVPIVLLYIGGMSMGLIAGGGQRMRVTVIPLAMIVPVVMAVPIVVIAPAPRHTPRISVVVVIVALLATSTSIFLFFHVTFSCDVLSGTQFVSVGRFAPRLPAAES